MALINKGATTYVFGISGISVTGTIQSFNISREYTNVVEARGEDGDLAAKRYDDIHGTGSVTFLFESDPGDSLGTATFTYDGNSYWLESKTKSLTAGGYAEITYNIRDVEGYTS